eukprot:12087171-Heterocapsa_arctica.AAC.1
MQRCLRKEGLPLQEALASMLNIDLPLLSLEDNSQCIAAVVNSYSPNLRHMARVQRTCVGSLHEAFSRASRKTHSQVRSMLSLG